MSSPVRFEFDGLQFGEGPRWHDGALWCSDMFGHRVLRHRLGHEPEEVVRVADDLDCPNGIVLTPDGSTLIVAESFGGRLTAYDVGADGWLSARRIHAELPASDDHVHPDGICVDGEGGVWLADLTYR